MALSELEKSEIEAAFLRDKVEFQAWLPKSPELLDEQIYIKQLLTLHCGARHFGRNCYVARGAKVHTHFLSLGHESWIASGAIVRGHITIGNHCTINPYAHIAGKVRIGDGVRIAGLASIYGFNHGFSRTDIPVYAQPVTMKGIEIGNGCWIGANAVIVDGVTLGDHSIVAGGSVVTADFPQYSIVGGNPARLIRNRLADVKSEHPEVQMEQV